MLGAIIGDIVGSRWEFNPIKTKDFEYLEPGKNRFTDDTVMTIAIAYALLNCSHIDRLGEAAKLSMLYFGNKYPTAGYGKMFIDWLFSDDPKPYNSFGNGAAMRVSPCGEMARSIEEAKELSRRVTEVTHNHPEGIKGAEAVAVSIYLAKSGKSLEEIKEYINDNYYPMNFTLDKIRDSYQFDATCQGSVPQALMCAFEANSFEDAIRNAVSLGGDSDTLAAIAGSVAGSHYSITHGLQASRIAHIPIEFKQIIYMFLSRCPLPNRMNWLKEQLSK